MLKEKVVCFWSKDYDDREKHKREKLKERIATYLESPIKLKSSNSCCIKKYLKLQNLDEETGEIKDIELFVEYDEEKYNRDVSLAGYYTIVTSELELNNEYIIKKYKGLWKIEESFRVLKTDLSGSGSCQVCFLALLISRILEMKLDNKHSAKQIQNSLKSTTCRKIINGIYSFSYQDEVNKAVTKKFNVSLDYENIRIETLRNWSKEIVHNIKY